ncbi:ATP-binding cassette domain-containing protein [Pengzhenrongella sicca]|uniref:ATP-binding cassette domain-containing protein n=1 Tax=Pengzhenrongella sicca TaxID=2819238 RepID=A0A8A4Z979_9MICO|nr:ATP-binding cassette domain-containing protein [Pengzhenrongella sicca]QTE27981.1 ATP-binding cassette domain-containing protein [Pengzhenrongella sicca]
MTTTPIISARGLSKRFRGPAGAAVVAVSDLTMDVEAGPLTAFLGPNGAGKSTSLRMLTTLLEPTGGTARVCGFDVAQQPAEVRARIGYIGQKNGAGQYQRVRDELLSQGALYGLGRVERRRRVDELLEVLELGELADRPTMKLSGGQRRRVDIALGLIAAPRLLFLDEPSTGLDPQSRAHLWAHLITLRERYEMTLFLTTHYLDEADQFAERVLVVDRGRLIADDSPAGLKARLAGDRITLTVTSDSGSASATDDVAHLVRRAARESGAPDAEPTLAETAVGTRLAISVHHGDRVLPRLVLDLHASGHHVVAAELARPTLDDVFLTLTGRSLREDHPGEPAADPIPATAGAL